MPNSKSFKETCRLLALNDASTTCFVNLEGENLHEGMGRLAHAISQNTVVTRLCLRHCYVHDDDVDALVASLRYNRHVDTLDCKDNFISRAGAAKLAASSLRRLRLESNCVGDGGCAALAAALRRNRSLIFLNLTDNGICAAGAADLACGLRENPVLTYLNLSRNEQLGDSGAESIASSYLRGSQSLAHLSLSGAGVGDAGAAAVADALKANGSVSDLDLSRNRITGVGAAAIASALEVSCSLRCVRLGHNDIRDDGASNVAFALFRNEVLERLDCESCGIRSSGASCLAIALQKNYSLRRLDLDGNADVRDEIGTFIAEALRKNADPDGRTAKKAAFYLSRERAEDLPSPLKKRLLFVLWIAQKIDAGRIMNEEKPLGSDIWWYILGMLCGSDLVPANRSDHADDLSAVFDSWLYPCGSRLEDFVGSI